MCVLFISFLSLLPNTNKALAYYLVRKSNGIEILGKKLSKSCVHLYLEDSLFAGNSLKCTKLTTRHLEIEILNEN